MRRKHIIERVAEVVIAWANNKKKLGEPLSVAQVMRLAGTPEQSTCSSLRLLTKKGVLRADNLGLKGGRLTYWPTGVAQSEHLTMRIVDGITGRRRFAEDVMVNEVITFVRGSLRLRREAGAFPWFPGKYLAELIRDCEILPRTSGRAIKDIMRSIRRSGEVEGAGIRIAGDDRIFWVTHPKLMKEYKKEWGEPIWP